jgi:RNA polymerase sigma-70 factor (ECF subfamily)
MGDDEITAYALAAGQGEREALTAFIRGTQADVWRYVAYIAGREHADDLTQETYLRTMRSLPGFRGETAARTWLMSIARRTAMDHFRRLRRSPMIAGSTEVIAMEAQPAVRYPDPAGELALRSLIVRLEPDRRAAFVLTQLLGLRYSEAALVCAVPIGTIRSRVARAREDLAGWVAAADSVREPPARGRGLRRAQS